MKFFPMIPNLAIIAILLLVIAVAVFCGFNKNYRRVSNFRRLGIAVLVLFILLRPTVIDVETERYINQLNVYFVVDNTGSMVTKDMFGGKKYRYEQMREDIIKYVNLFTGAKFTAIVSDYDVYQAAPLTGNTSSIIGFANSFKPKDNILSSWTNLGDLLDKTNERIENYNEKNPDRASILIMMSDGEESGEYRNNITTEIPKKLANNIVGGAIIGYGDVNNEKKVTKIRLNEPTDEEIDHVSKLNETNLQNIANKLGLNYYNRNESDYLFDNNTRYLSQFSAYKQEGDINSRFELYWLLALLIVALLIWDFSDILNELFSERKAK